MKLLLLLIRSSWLMGLSSALLSALSGVATLGLISLIHQALSENAAQHVLLPLKFSLACVLVLVTQVASKYMLVRLSQSTAARLRYELCTRIAAAPLPQLEAIGAHRLTVTLSDDVNAISGALSGLPNMCANVMVLLSGLGYLASLSLPLAAGTVGMAGFGIAVYFTGLRFGNYYLRQARVDGDEVAKQTRDMIHGLRELKGNHYRCLDFIYGVLLPADADMRKRLITGTTIQEFAHSWGRLFLFIGIGFLLFVSPMLWPTTASTLTGYTLTILYLTYPLDGIIGWLPAMNHATIAVSQIKQMGLLISDGEVQALPPVTPPFESLELRGITYEYTSSEGRSFALGPLDLKIAAGEELFIAGGNGSGKTTLAKLLIGLYVPLQGQILLNGQVVTNGIRGNYRQLFSTVFVEGHVFDRLLGIDVDQDRLQYWAHLLGIESKVDFETGRFDTQKLSRGQHKRLALLVACLDGRPIFVFDEWAAEQDPGFKEVFYRQILPELRRQGKTTIAITHDDRYFSAADRVLTLVDGRLDAHAKGMAA